MKRAIHQGEEVRLGKPFEFFLALCQKELYIQTCWVYFFFVKRRKVGYTRNKKLQGDRTSLEGLNIHGDSEHGP